MQPDFNELLKVLRREKSSRPVLFEFLIDNKYARKYSNVHKDATEGSFEYFLMLIDSFLNLGYDYAHVYSWLFDSLHFPMAEHEKGLSRSQNEGALITDEASFDRYPWPDISNCNYDIFEKLLPHLPEGMKLLASSWGGLLENVTDIVGFENLCMLYLLEPKLCRRIFDHVGSRLVEHYRIVSAFDSVGVCTINDDWGFRNQTMFPPEMMREYVYPWTRKMVNAVKENGKPVIFHSCGNLKEIMTDVINDLGMDGKHSYEDAIYPVEDAIDWWNDEIAIVGGIDVDYLCRTSPEEIGKRAFALLEKTFDKGGYALGSGNSIAHYVPEESYLAILNAARKFEKEMK